MSELVTVYDLIQPHIVGEPPKIHVPDIPIVEYKANVYPAVKPGKAIVHRGVRLDINKYIPRVLLTTYVCFDIYKNKSHIYSSTIFGEPLTDMLYAQIHSNITNYLFMDLVKDLTIFNFVSISVKSHRLCEPVNVNWSEKLFNKLTNNE
jgi:hypothetical protein